MSYASIYGIRSDLTAVEVKQYHDSWFFLSQIDIVLGAKYLNIKDTYKMMLSLSDQRNLERKVSKAKIIEKILSINPDEVVTDTKVVLVEQHDDAIAILNKYHSSDSCIVCDNPSFNGDILLERKKENRKNIYDNLDDKTKDILDKIVRDSSISSSDPFDIKRIVGAFIAGEDSISLFELQQELMTFINSIENEMVDALFHCFDGTSLFDDFDEYAQLVETQPQLDSEELLFIENVINENIGKDITIVRDEDNDRNYKLKIGNKDLLGTDRKEMELSTGEQNFISLAFELGQFTRNYTQTVKRAADNKRRYAPGWVHSTCLLRGFPKGAAPHLAHDFAKQSVVCYGTVKNLAHFSDSLISPPSGAATPPAESRPDSASSPTRSRPRT